MIRALSFASLIVVSRATHLKVEIIFSNETGYPSEGVVFGQTSSGSLPLNWTSTHHYGKEICQDQTIVCTLKNGSASKLEHVAHVAQALFPCWSLFMNAEASERRVVLMEDGLELCSYGKALVREMEAELIHRPADMSDNMLGICGTGSSLARASGDGLQWFSSRTHPGLLRDKILEDINIHTSHALRIGILNRDMYVGRHLIYSRELMLRLEYICEENDQDCEIDETTFDGKTLIQQAEWIYAHDIIISPHGNQITNIAYARACTVLVELFPKNYFLPTFFQALAYDSKVIPYYVYVNPPHVPDTFEERTLVRGANLYFTPYDVVSHWDDILKARNECLHPISSIQKPHKTRLRH